MTVSLWVLINVFVFAFAVSQKYKEMWNTELLSSQGPQQSF